MKYNTYTMADVLEVIIDYRGKTPKKSEKGIPTLSAKTIKNGYIDYSKCYYISSDEYKKFMVRGFPKKGDVLLTTEAPLGEVAKLDRDDVAIAQRLLTLRGKKGILDNDYLLYFLQSPNGQYLLKSRESGTTVTGIKQAEFRKIQLEIPEFAIQKKISSVLCILDDKIKLNNQINNNLEQQAQAIYKYFFIDNKYEISSECKLGDVCECLLGGTPSRAKPEYWNGNISWINSGEVNRFRITSPSEYITEEGLNRSTTKLLPAKTIVLAITGATLGQVSILEIDSCANQSVVGIVPNDRLPYEFIYPFINSTIKELVSHQTGGAQQHINKQNIEGLSLLFPTQEVIQKFRSIVAPIYETIANNCFENKRLNALRDVLLPKLMSGELDVSDIEL